MIQQDFILLIMNCKKYTKKALYQKQTWLKQIPSYLKYYHVIGDEELEKEYVFDNENMILWIKVADDYNSLPKKVIGAYKAVTEVFNFKYLFKTDDDQILVKPDFFDVIVKITQTHTPVSHYGGYVINIEAPCLSQYNKIHPELPDRLILYKTKYCSGRFYFLSKHAVNDLVSKKHLIEKEYFEDYAIGFYLHDIFKTSMLNIKTNNYFTDIELSDFPKLIEQNKI